MKKLLIRLIHSIMIMGCFVLGIGEIGYAQTEKKINWIGYDLPPYHILRGSFQGKGVLDQWYEIWQNSLPEYEHRIINVNLARMTKEMQTSQKNTCVTGSFKLPDATEKRVWSKAIYVEPPAVILTTDADFKKLGSPKIISLESLIKDQTYTYGHVKERPYYGNVDSILEAHLNQKNIHMIATKTGPETAMKLLKLKRIDWGLFFLPEPGWQAAGLGYDKSLFRTIAIQGHDILSPVYMNCTNNEWGQSIVKHLNQIIDKNIKEKGFEVYQNWVIDQQGIELFRAAQARYFENE